MRGRENVHVLTASQAYAYRWHNGSIRGANVTITNQDTRKRLIINRHIAKMTPEEIARRFSIYVMLRTACSNARSHGKAAR